MCCGRCGSNLDETNESQVVCAACGACEPTDQFHDIDWGLFESEAAGFDDALRTSAAEVLRDVPPDDGDPPFSDDLLQEGIEAGRLLLGSRLALFMTSDDVNGCVIH